MQFSKMKYERVPIDELLHEFAGIAKKVEAATGAEETLALFWQFEQIAQAITTAQTIAEIRHTINTEDTFYEEENNFYDANSPRLSDAMLKVYNALLSSKYKAEIEKSLGGLLIEKLEQNVKSMSPEILELMAQENELTTQYVKLYASAQIEFGGKKLTVSEMSPYKQSTDRAVRESAYRAEGEWFDANAKELDELYDKLVHNRNAQGRAMGYDNYIPLAVIRMRRIGYTLEDMQSFREQIVSDVVPIVAKLKDLQKKRVGIDDFKFWDDSFCFKDGNAIPKGSPEELLLAGQEMYHELSSETSAFIDMMTKNDLFDVLSKKGKAPGGYCTYIPGYKAPFIFSNFNGTADDVDVLTHEAGHAFAAYIAAGKDLASELEEPGMESCEIHSMSMEFLTADYHNLFFKEDTAKYELAHAEDAMYFLPYGTMVDEFQHIMYANENLTPSQRNEEWLRLEHKYRPWIDFDNLPFYARGAGWQRQLHIYEYPFYYIDYCLAQSVALQFFIAFNNDKKDAWKRYVKLVGKAGTESYSQLVETAGFKSPFKYGTMKQISNAVYDWIINYKEIQ